MHPHKVRDNGYSTNHPETTHASFVLACQAVEIRVVFRGKYLIAGLTNR
jgi:hypothetical protein